ncbi:MAG: ABC transporter substrate-binding protein/permease, partial [Fibrobacter sp.]|nr:ABC transporter substrate-binding protein/permease [Fibrobacter sp.]
MYYDGAPNLAIALQQKKIDAFIVDEPLARQVALNTPGLMFVDEPITEDKYGFAFQKNEEGGRLRDEFNVFLRSARNDGIIDSLDVLWFGSDETKKVLMQANLLPAINGTVRFASNMESAPFNYVSNSQSVGMEIDLMQRFCKEKGYGLELNTVSFGALLQGLISDNYDVVASCLTITEERAKNVYFSEPFYTGGVVAVVLDNANNSNEVSLADPNTGFFASLVSSFRKNFVVESRWKLLVSGIGITLLLSICSGILGIIIGFGFCLLRMSNRLILDKTTVAVTRILQGTPMVVLLMILYYVVLNKTGLDGVSVAIIAFGLNFGAYASEIMLSGILAVDNGQREAAAAIGFTPVQTFVKIVFPQAARHFLPVLKGEYISLVKMTSIVGYVAVLDLTKVSDIIRSRTYEAFFPLIVTAIIYFVLSFGLSSLLKLIEIRIDPKHRPRTLKGVKLQ